MQAVVRSRIEPGIAPPEAADVKVAALQIARFTSVISSSPRAEGLIERSDVKHTVFIEIKACHRPAGFRPLGFSSIVTARPVSPSN